MTPDPEPDRSAAPTGDDDSADVLRPLCFVLMPFGVKQEVGGEINFDRVYEQVIRPAVDAAGMDCLRGDEEQVGGIIHKPMFERLLLCEFAIADLSTANPNVSYELGVRHAVRPWSTVLIYAEGLRLPFDVAPVRAVHYALDEGGHPATPDTDSRRLAAALTAARRRITDSPVFQLVDGLVAPNLTSLNGVAFRDREAATQGLRHRLRSARKTGTPALEEFHHRLGDLDAVEVGILVELLLAYRAQQAYPQMIALVEQMPDLLARLPQVREQYALALNRTGRGEDAEDVLRALITARGPSSETYGLLGRVYKDRWEAARDVGDTAQAAWLLDHAIRTYLAGFEADLRDFYPGINAVELIFLREPEDPRLAELIPVVRYAATVKARGRADYWECATLLQLAVMDRDRESARTWLGAALATRPDQMATHTTADSLHRIRAATPFAEDADWILDLEQRLRAQP